VEEIELEEKRNGEKAIDYITRPRLFSFKMAD